MTKRGPIRWNLLPLTALLLLALPALISQAAEQWRPTLVGAPMARAYHTAVWTGSKMVVWGGYNGSSPLDTGGRYVP
jgi:hypothetical protein